MGAPQSQLGGLELIRKLAGRPSEPDGRPWGTETKKKRKEMVLQVIVPYGVAAQEANIVGYFGSWVMLLEPLKCSLVLLIPFATFKRPH